MPNCLLRDVLRGGRSLQLRFHRLAARAGRRGSECAYVPEWDLQDVVWPWVRLCGVSPRALLCRAEFTREQQRGAGRRARRRAGSAAREIQGERSRGRVKGRLRAPWLRALEVGNITSWALLLAFAVSVLARHPRMQR
jgi:hypothetical protein